MGNFGFVYSLLATAALIIKLEILGVLSRTLPPPKGGIPQQGYVGLHLIRTM